MAEDKTEQLLLKLPYVLGQFENMKACFCDGVVVIVISSSECTDVYFMRGTDRAHQKLADISIEKRALQVDFQADESGAQQLCILTQCQTLHFINLWLQSCLFSSNFLVNEGKIQQFDWHGHDQIAVLLQTEFNQIFFLNFQIDFANKEFSKVQQFSLDPSWNIYAMKYFTQDQILAFARVSFDSKYHVHLIQGNRQQETLVDNNIIALHRSLDQDTLFVQTGMQLYQDDFEGLKPKQIHQASGKDWLFESSSMTVFEKKNENDLFYSWVKVEPDDRPKSKKRKFPFKEGAQKKAKQRRLSESKPKLVPKKKLSDLFQVLINEQVQESSLVLRVELSNQISLQAITTQKLGDNDYKIVIKHGRRNYSFVQDRLLQVQHLKKALKDLMSQEKDKFKRVTLQLEDGQAIGTIVDQVTRKLLKKVSTLEEEGYSLNIVIDDSQTEYCQKVLSQTVGDHIQYFSKQPSVISSLLYKLIRLLRQILLSLDDHAFLMKLQLNPQFNELQQILSTNQQFINNESKQNVSGVECLKSDMIKELRMQSQLQLQSQQLSQNHLIISKTLGCLSLLKKVIVKPSYDTFIQNQFTVPIQKWNLFQQSLTATLSKACQMQEKAFDMNYQSKHQKSLKKPINTTELDQARDSSFCKGTLDQRSKAQQVVKEDHKQDEKNSSNEVIMRQKVQNTQIFLRTAEKYLARIHWLDKHSKGKSQGEEATEQPFQNAAKSRELVRKLCNKKLVHKRTTEISRIV